MYSDALGFIECAADTGCIHQLYRDTANRHRLRDQIARSAGSRGNNRALAFNESIEQTGFADIRTTYDRQRKPFMNQFSVCKRTAKFFERGAHFRDVLTDLLPRQNRDIVFREINSGLEQCD